jgi:hypothetical protein
MTTMATITMRPATDETRDRVLREGERVWVGRWGGWSAIPGNDYVFRLGRRYYVYFWGLWAVMGPYRTLNSACRAGRRFKWALYDVERRADREWRRARERAWAAERRAS